MKIGILMLAAGASRRFGADKRHAKLADGRCVLQTSVEIALATELPLRVCLAPTDQQTGLLLDDWGATAIYCAGAQQGMGLTLAQGIVQLPAWDGVLISLADMPFIQPDTYLTIARAATIDSIVQPRFGTQNGHPVGFGRTFFPQLQRLTGDTGGRSLLRNNSSAVSFVDIRDVGILRDIDVPDDLPV